MARQFQFVTVSNPTEPASSESRKLNHSHVMRQAHAKKRRLQTQRYQNESIICGTKQDLTIFKSVLSSPLSHVFTNSKDPFSSLARPLTSEEYFLLDHCMFIDAMSDCLPGHHFVILTFGMGFSSSYTLDPFRSDISNSITDIQVIVPYSVGHCGLFDYPGDHRTQMLREWVGLAITDDALMVAAVLLSTCRYILLDQPDHPVFTRMALQYKQICLRTLRQEISTKSSPINAMTVAKAVALAIDEVSLL